jgi:hypothetical protein
MDPKWPVVARRAKVSVAEVAAVWWSLCDYASQQEDRGSIEGFDPEIVAVFFQIEQTAVQAVMQALQDKASLNGARIANWDEYQPDEGSAERMRRHRAVTPPSHTVTNKESDEKHSISKSESSSSESGKEGEQLFFEAWYANFPRRQGRARALKAFRAALKKTDFDTLMAGVERYKAEKPGYADWAMPATWLNDERWLDEASPSGVVQQPPKGAPKAFVSTDKDAQWAGRMRGFVKNRYWSTNWGPAPGEPGCECPAKFLINTGEAA